MSEFSQNNEAVEIYVAERQVWLADAVAEVVGDREADPREVFPAPTEPRADAILDPIMEGHVPALRPIAERFGLGAEQDVPGTAEVRILEGGKPWKIEAEAAMSVSTAETVIFSASPFRNIGADEMSYVVGKYGVDDGTNLSEYDVAKLIAGNLEGYETLEEPLVMPFGYEVNADNAITEESTGQLVQIGTVNNKPVMLLRVDRENYVDDEGKNKYRFQPDGAKLMKFVSGVLRATGDETSGVGFDSSNTYASRAIDTVRAGYEDGRRFDYGMYGRATLRRLVVGTKAYEDGIVKVPAETPANQIPGELHVIASKLEALRELIESN